MLTPKMLTVKRLVLIILAIAYTTALHLVSKVIDFVLLCYFPVLLHNALPFVGFGFLDNCIMIVAVSRSNFGE